jgi:hypothetical protein
MRALRMAGNLRLLPGRQLGVDFSRRIAHARLQPGDFVMRVDAFILLAQFLQFEDFPFQV